MKNAEYDQRCWSRTSPPSPRPDDLDLLFFDGPGEAVEQVRVLADPYVLVARRGTFPVGPVPLRALHGAPLVAQPPICDQARVERVYAEHGVAPLIVFRTADNRGVVSMVRAGMGVAVLPLLARDVLCTHPLDPVIAPREIYLMWRAGRTLSPLVREVVAATREVAAEVDERRR